MRFKGLMRIKVYFLNRLIRYGLKPFLNLLKDYKNNLIIHKLNKVLHSFLNFILKIKRKNIKHSFLVVGRDNVNWSIDRDRKHAEYFLKLNHIKTSKSVIRSTHILSVWYDLFLRPNYLWIKFLKNFLKYHILAIVTSDIKYKRNNWKVDKLKDIIDVWICPSRRIYNFLGELGFEVKLIPFYVDENIFKVVNNSKKEICTDIGLDYKKIKDKIVIGSFQRDSMPSLEAPKWQKDPDLLIKIISGLPQNSYILLLAGPRRHYIIGQCEKLNIPYIFFGDYKYIFKKKDDTVSNNLSLETINLLYNLTDIYIVSSFIEGGPKAILESGLTKTLISSTNVGLASDFLHGDLIYSREDTNKVINLIRNFHSNKEKINKYIEYNYHQVSTVINKNNYKKLFKNLLE